jgi:murein DD-endopeptidase MepM/ murein hydrolase activator NlpD
MNRDQIVENLIRQILNEKETNIGGPFKTDLENGPKNHGSRALGNWQSDNAWDIFAPPGSVVNSYTNGKVLKVKASGKRSGKIYGTQVTVTGDEGYPDIFYTHLKNVNLQKGDVVKVGDKIGEVSEWDTSPKSTHVHIGLPRGKHLRDLLKNSSVIFSGRGTAETPDGKAEDLTDFATDAKPKKETKPKSGLDNLGDFLKYLKTGQLPATNIGNTLDDVEDESQEDKTETQDDQSTDSVVVDIANYKITEPSPHDKDFYNKVLTNLGAPVSKQNLLFFYAWRQAEGAKSTYNPFNTTQPKEGSTLWNCLSKKGGKCVGGVRNYKTKQDGIDATVKTITNGNYKCIVDGLKSDKGASKIAECSDLKKWGTGGGITRVLKTKKINPPAISTTQVKSVNESFNNETQRISDLIKKVL